MNGTTTIAEFRDAVLDPAKRAHYRLAWLSTVDHKRIAVLYMLTALVFFVIAGVEALFMRLQLAVPNNHFLHPDTFNQLFTMHGTTMIFLVVISVRPRKLRPAITDRRSRYGFPAPQRLWFLVCAVWRNSFAL